MTGMLKIKEVCKSTVQNGKVNGIKSSSRKISSAVRMQLLFVCWLVA